MTKEERNEAKTYLKRGDVAEIARISGLSRDAVSRTLNNKLKYSSCIPFIKKIVAKRRNEVDSTNV